MKKNNKSLLNSARLLRMETLENRELLDASSILGGTPDSESVVAAIQTGDVPVDLSGLEEENAGFSVVAGETANSYVATWDAIEGAVAYTVKISRDGGETWLTYRKGLTEPTATLNGVYTGKAYDFRVVGIDENGKAVGEEITDKIIPVAFAPADSTYTDGETISVSLAGAEGATADVVWYKVLDGGLVEIEEARGLLEYAPTENIDLQIVAIGTNYSEGSSAVVNVSYVDERVVNVDSYDASTRVAQLSWIADDDATGYVVKISRNGGESFITYRKGLTEPNCEILGLYANHDYSFRVFSVNENGKIAATYNDVKFSPFTATATLDVYAVGQELSYNLVGTEAVSATPNWYYVTPTGDVEIEGTAGLDTIVPLYANYPIKLVLSGVADSAYEVLSLNITAPGANVAISSYDTATRLLGLTWEPMLNADSYNVKISKDGGETWTTYAKTDSESVTVKGIYVNKNYSFCVYGYTAEGGLVGVSNVKEVSPLSVKISSEVWNDGDTIKLTLAGSDSVTADVVWYAVDMETGEETELEELRGMTEYTPTEALDVRVVVTAGGLAEGQQNSFVVYYHGVPETPSTVVDSTLDVVDPRDGVITLREAIEVYAVDGDTITLADSVMGETFVLNSAIEVAANVTIGDGVNLVSVDGDGLVDLFNVVSDAKFVHVDLVNADTAITVSNGANVELNDVFISRANVGVKVDGGALVVEDSEINNADVAIDVVAGEISVADSALVFSGVAIQTAEGVVTLANVIIAQGETALVLNSELALVDAYNVTIADNNVGVDAQAGAANLYNTILALNDVDAVLAEGAAINATNVLSSFVEWSNEDAVAYVYDPDAPLFATYEYTYTLAAVAGNQAIDKGDDDYVVSESDFFGNDRVLGLAVDLGASEADVETPSLVVDSLLDVIDPSDHVVTLREAIELYADGGDTITFAESLAGATISIGSAISVDKEVKIDGANVTLVGDAESTIFDVTANAAIFKMTLKSADVAVCVNAGAFVGITDVVFTDNAVAVKAAGAVQLSDVLAVDNDTAVVAEGLGSIVFAFNATIADNDLGVLADEGEILLANTILAANTTDALAQNEGAVKASNVLSSYADWANEDAVAYAYNASAPLFNAGDYTLARVSGNQAINKGDNSLVATDVDLAGAARVQGSVVDLGAYEAAPESESTVVTTLTDVVDPFDYQISLREAVENYAHTGNKITFDASLAGGTAVVNGSQIVIAKNITIDGGNNITVSGANATRIFRVTASDATVKKISLVNGSGNGGAIYAASNAGVTIDRVTMTGNSGENGGAVYASIGANITVKGSSFSGNKASAQGGAIYVGQNAKVNIADTTIANNSATNRGGAISVANAGGALTVTGGSITGNTSQSGAALYFTGDISATITTTISGNTASDRGAVMYSSASGTVTFDGCTISNNTAAGNGGVISITGGTVNVNNSTVSNNKTTGGNGGAFFTTGGTINANNTTVSGNQAVNGGAIATNGGTINLVNAAVRSNKANNTGSAVYTAAGTANLVGCLVTANNSGEFVVHNLGTTGLTNVTLAENSALGIYTTGTLTLRNSIVWNNSASNLQADGGTVNVSNVITQQGRTSGASAVSGSFWESDLDEAPYQYNTFQLKTYWRTEENISPINSGNNSYVSITTDLAGANRVVGGTIDLGAYENQSVSNALIDEAFAEFFGDIDD